MIGIVLAFFNVVASSQILPLLPKAGAKVIQFPDLQKIMAGRSKPFLTLPRWRMLNRNAADYSLYEFSMARRSSEIEPIVFISPSFTNEMLPVSSETTITQASVSSERPVAALWRIP